MKPMSPTRARSFAFIDLLAHRRRVRLAAGLPAELSPGEAESGSMPLPDALLLLEGEQGSAFLDGITGAGAWSGDDWFPNVEEALAAAAEEYGTALSSWRELPVDVTSPYEYVLALWARERGASA